MSYDRFTGGHYFCQLRFPDASEAEKAKSIIEKYTLFGEQIRVWPSEDHKGHKAQPESVIPMGWHANSLTNSLQEFKGQADVLSPGKISSVP
jgi:hypothetical protein